MRRARVKNGVAPKQCAVCDRPFEWRKKWKNNFDAVKYCSTRCRAEARRRTSQP